MQANNPLSEANQPHDEIAAEQEAEYRRECRKLNDLAFTFLNAAGGDVAQAEKLLDDAIDLLLESGVLPMWRYRAVLAGIREGL